MSFLKRKKSKFDTYLKRNNKGSNGPYSEEELELEEVEDNQKELLAVEAAKKAEEERLAKEAAEAAKKAEEERLAKEAAEAAKKAEEERLAKEAAKKAEEERIAKEAAEAAKKAEEERIAKEAAEAAKKAEEERLAKEAAEAAKKAEEERLAKEAARKEELERMAKELEEQRRLAALEMEALQREQVTVQEAKEVVSDEVAEALIEVEEETEKIYGTKKGIINLDVISKHFNAGDVVTVNILKEKKLIDKNICFIKVLARGVLDKPLTIKAQDFSIDAAKMIELTGGHVVMLTKRKYFN